MKTILVLAVFLFCNNSFAQIDSVENFKTGYIFSVEYSDTDTTENDIDEVKIYSMSDSILDVGYNEYKIDKRENISLRSIKKIGYKSGKSSGKYIGIGVLTGVGAIAITAAITAKKGSGHTDGYEALGYVVIALGFPIIGGVTGAIIGAFVDNYMMYDLVKFDSDLITKSKRVKLVIKEGIKYSH